MRAPLRQEARRMLTACAAKRPPALRRCLTPDALLATDLPLCAGSAEVEAFIRRAAAAGWAVKRQGDWLTLDHPLALCPADLPDSAEGEACRSLLARHPGLTLPSPLLRRLWKAMDAGRIEEALWPLHQALAAALREGLSRREAEKGKGNRE